MSSAYLGKARPLPLVLGPVGFSGLFAPHGEIQAARAAHAAGIPFCLSNFGLTSLEDLRAATTGAIWFQLYILKDRSLSEAFLVRAERAGVEALCVTVDTPIGGVRERGNRQWLPQSHASDATLGDGLSKAAHVVPEHVKVVPFANQQS